MNSALRTVTEEELKKGVEMDKSDAKETAVYVPDENIQGVPIKPHDKKF